ncbi:hypothetical protein BH11PLA2_BH11PLA2_40920 [soil metagenome]
MYPISAVLVNCGDGRPFNIRAALTELAVTIADEFARVDDLLMKWPTPPPDRKVIVTRVQGLKQTTIVGKINDAFPGWPIVALLDGQPDAQGLYTLSRTGAAQLLPYPTTSDDLAKAMDRIAIQFALIMARSRVIVVTGAAPGCGATTVALNLAAECAGLFQLSTTLVEMELVLGRFAGLLDLYPPNTIRDILANPQLPTLASVEAALIPFGERLQVLAGPHQRVEPFQPQPGRVSHLLGVLKRLSTVTVVDLPVSFDAAYFEAVATANRVVLVGRQDVPTVQAMKLLGTDLVARGLPPPVMIVNAFQSELKAFSAERLGELLGRPPLKTIVKCTSALRGAADTGRTLALAAPDSVALADIREITEEILKELELPIPDGCDSLTKRKSFLGRLFGG